MPVTVKRLRKLGETLTQAGAARKLKVSRAYVGQLAKQYDIQFVVREVADAPSICTRCRRQRHVGHDRCLRCYWTPNRIRTLRQRSSLSSQEWSIEVLEMAIWTAGRWESGANHPNRKSLVLLETLNDDWKCDQVKTRRRWALDRS